MGTVDPAPALAAAPALERGLRVAPIWPVARLWLRADRRRTLSFAALLGALAYVQPAAYRNSYPMLADRLAFAHAFGGDQALRLLYGTPHRLVTVGGYTSWRVAQIAAMICGVWAALAAVRALRGEEQSGRAEVLLALAVSRGAMLTATLVALLIETGVLWAAVVAGLVLAGLPLAGSLVLAVAICCTAPVFGVIGALAAQLVPSSRRALELALGCVALAFAIRVVADTVSGAAWLRWGSPLGWVELVRPFAAPVIAGLLVPAAASTIGIVLAARIAAHRDLGASLWGDADAHPPRLALLQSTLQFSLRRERATLLVWTAAIAAFGCLVGAISAAVSAAALPPGVRHVFARVISGSVVTPAGYLGFASLLFVLAVSLFAVAQLAAARRAETDGELDTLLALPVSAARWLAGRLLFTAIAIVALAATVAVCLWAGATVAGAKVPLPGLFAAGANCVAVASLFAGIGALAFAIWPAVGVGATYALVTAAFLWQLVAAALGAPAWLHDLTPFAHLGLAPAASFRVSAAVLMALTGVVGLLAGPLLLRRRDLGMS